MSVIHREEKTPINSRVAKAVRFQRTIKDSIAPSDRFIYRPGILVTDEDLFKLCPATRPAEGQTVDEALCLSTCMCELHRTLRNEIEADVEHHN